MDIRELFSSDNLVAGAIVGLTLAVKMNAEIENKTVEGASITSFSDMVAAIKWVNSIVEQEELDT